MTGSKLLEAAASLMGFEVVTEEMVKIGPTVISFVLEDLGHTAPSNLDEEFTLSESVLSATQVGTAMLLSVALGDLRSKECFSAIYTEKRGKIKGSKSRVLDSLPKGELL